MKILVNILLFSFCSIAIIAQDVDYDTLTDAEVEHEFYGKTKFEFKLSRDRSIITSGKPIRGSTLKIGVRFKRNYKVGFAIFFSDELDIQAPENPDISHYKLSFDGVGIYSEYVVFKNYRFEFSTPVSLVSVKAKAKAFNLNEDRASHADTASNRFGMFSLGVGGTYNLNYWLGVGAGLGYRFAFSDNAENNNILSTPFYAFGIKIQLGKLYKTTFHHEQVLKLKSIHFRDRNPTKSAHYNKRYHQIAKRKAKKNNR